MDYRFFPGPPRLECSAFPGLDLLLEDERYFKIERSPCAQDMPHRIGTILINEYRNFNLCDPTRRGLDQPGYPCSYEVRR